MEKGRERGVLYSARFRVWVYKVVRKEKTREGYVVRVMRLGLQAQLKKVHSGGGG